jgi:hypothetical protein
VINPDSLDSDALTRVLRRERNVALHGFAFACDHFQIGIVEVERATTKPIMILLAWLSDEFNNKRLKECDVQGNAWLEKSLLCFAFINRSSDNRKQFASRMLATNDNSLLTWQSLSPLPHVSDIAAIRAVSIIES